MGGWLVEWGGRGEWLEMVEQWLMRFMMSEREMQWIVSGWLGE